MNLVQQKALSAKLRRIPPDQWRKLADAIEMVRAIGGTPDIFPRKDWIAGGIYARQVFIPAGGLLIGKIHLVEHFFNLSAGVILLWTPSGGARILRAPLLGVTQPGEMRIGLALEDVVWTTFHAVGELKDPEEIENLVTLDPRKVPGLLEDVCRLELPQQ